MRLAFAAGLMACALALVPQISRAFGVLLAFILAASVSACNPLCEQKADGRERCFGERMGP